MRAYALQMMITIVHDRMMFREFIFWRDAKRVCDAIFYRSSQFRAWSKYMYNVHVWVAVIAR